MFYVKFIRQGLFYLNRRLFESCGQYGFSKLNELKLSKKNFKATTITLHYNENEIFGEGSDYVLGIYYKKWN